MNTTLAVATVIVKSPVLLAATASGVAASAVAVGSVLKSASLIDDAVLLVVLALLVCGAYFQPNWAVAPVERLEPRVVWRLATEERRAALTIDDVPLLKSPSILEDILDVCKAHNVKATLFIMSGFADGEAGMRSDQQKRFKALLQRAVKEGHELANHMQFDRAAIAMSDAEFDLAFKHCDEFLAGLHGGEKAWRKRPLRWFRPASALWTQRMLGEAGKLGYTTVIGNCYPHDVACSSSFVNAQYLARRARPGAVLIVHDRHHTAATLDKALPMIAAKGIKLGTLSELHAIAAPPPMTPEERKRK